jgi:predicted O-methyltransferase YrrM
MLKKLKKIFFYLNLIKKNNFFKYINYNDSKERALNEKLFDKISLNKKKIISILKSQNYDYYDPKLSFHYALFAGLSKNNENLKILEIGTHLGNFTNFLSKIFPLSTIYTCDLEPGEEFFNKNFKNNKNLSEERFYDIRKKNLANANITFKSLNSFDLLNNFDQNSFDLIWLDGDHFNPQVTMDVISAYYLIKKGGLLFCDDICFDKSNRTDGFGPINYLTKISKIETTYFLKRITKNNLIFKKYVSCSKKK